MLKKCSCLLLSLLLILFVSNIAYASDIVMDLNTATNSANTSSETGDNTIYSDVQDNTVSDVIDTSEDLDYDETIPTTTITEDYDDTSAELSISNMINIILIVVGVVLILLGIAIIIKIK